MIKHVLLTLLSHPAPTPGWALAAADGLAVHLDAELDAVVATIHIPDVSNALARRLVGADAAIAAENQAIRAEADALSSRFAAVVGSSDPHRQKQVESCGFVDPNAVALHARLFDLTLLPIFGHPDERWLIEGLLFGSGRPLLLLPKRTRVAWDHIVVAWDGSRAAARALADALPLCRRAKAVEIITITGEKPLPPELSPVEVRHHLARHGIMANGVERPVEGEDVGADLLAHAVSRSADLLVMGGFGHSRLREFFLGGATQSIIQKPTLPILMSN
ncbi:universal stress protein [Rhizorhabdus dicambivorans]|uniref:Universal stress protein n=1 Tax=Rhizorhabdus dicambivorans TaxID=1850238 RepID=A0A2A4FTL8_9SPHN|nr:universal stress protein [Rhizorhabdus dicambivorans]ATE63885.1 universal stress protein [Rhizorhabdus dicambivorans]PCE41489.1 universal stress protein [Rhizorhabdus dicambivorans]